jgi:hypothetical protein
LPNFILRRADAAPRRVIDTMRMAATVAESRQEPLRHVEPGLIEKRFG